MWAKSSIHALTPHTIVDCDEYLKTLEEVREKGYALDNEENELGVRCIAAGVTDYKGRPKYAFSISAPVSRMDDRAGGGTGILCVENERGDRPGDSVKSRPRKTFAGEAGKAQQSDVFRGFCCGKECR